jgi:hypothetical protein
MREGNPGYAREFQEAKREPYQPKGNSPAFYVTQEICEEDILIGDGFLERANAGVLAGPSGIGKSSIAMQIGCCWSDGKTPFDLEPRRPLRVMMVQHEDSRNDLIRMSNILNYLGLDPEVVLKNFWIETVRGKIGKAAIDVWRDLVEWWKADVLIVNPLSAYHEGDISSNEDNILFFYGKVGAFLEETQIGLFGIHHDIKPPRNEAPKQDSNYHNAKYELLGSASLTNFFRSIITVKPIPSSEVFEFHLAKRFAQSGWPARQQNFKWHEDKSRMLWVPASFVEAEEAKKSAGKTLEDLRKLVPVLGTIPREMLEQKANKAGFKRNEYRALLAEGLRDSTPDDLRIFAWSIYNAEGRANREYGRTPQPEDETHSAVKARCEEEREEQKRARKKQKEISSRQESSCRQTRRELNGDI